MKWLKRLFCKHGNLVFVRNIYGDEINAAGGKRSWWICADCGRMKLRARLKQYYRWEHKCPRCGGIVPSHDPLTGTCPVCSYSVEVVREGKRGWMGARSQSDPGD